MKDHALLGAQYNQGNRRSQAVIDEVAIDVEKRNSTLIFLADQENTTAGASEDLGAITIDEWTF